MKREFPVLATWHVHVMHAYSTALINAWTCDYCSVSSMCAAAISVRPHMYHSARRPAHGQASSVSRVDTIRQHFDQQRQSWDDQLQERCTHVWRKLQQRAMGVTAECEDMAAPNTTHRQGCDASAAALRLVSSDHVVSGSGVTWTVTYDIRDFLKTGSVEVHCDPDGIVVTATLNADISGSESLMRKKARSAAKVTKETFLIARVDHSSLRFQSQANGLMKISVSSKTLTRQTSKRSRASWMHTY